MNLDSCKCPGPSGFETLTFSCTEIRPLTELQQLCLFYTNTLSWQSSRRPPLLGTHAPLSIIQLLWKGTFLSGHIACPKEWPWPSSRMSLQICFSLQRTTYEASLLQQQSLISRNRSLRGQPSGNRPLGEKETIWLVLVQFPLLPSYVTLGSKSLSFRFLIFKTKQSDEVSSHLLSNSEFYHFTDYSYEGEEETRLSNFKKKA